MQKKKEPFIYVRLDSAKMKTELRRLAKEKKWSLKTYVNSIIEEHIQRHNSI